MLCVQIPAADFYACVCELFLIGRSDGSCVKEVSLGKQLLVFCHLCVCVQACVFSSRLVVFLTRLPALTTDTTREAAPL